jgi:transcriptional regulator with XRE-family HTH domain
VSSKSAERAYDRRVGLRVRRLRQHIGLSQSALARRVGFNVDGISKVERGTRSLKAHHLPLFAKALHAHVLALLPPIQESP